MHDCDLIDLDVFIAAEQMRFCIAGRINRYMNSDPVISENGPVWTY